MAEKKKVAEKKVAEKKAAAVKAPRKPKTEAAAVPKSAKKSSPKHEEIALGAYARWERQGRRHGSHEEHWLQTEKELRGTGK